MLTMRAEGSRLLSVQYQLSDGDHVVATICTPMLKQRCDLQVGPATYAIRQRGFVSIQWDMSRDGRIVASARGSVVVLGQQALTLESRGYWNEELVVSDGARELGTIRREGSFQSTFVGDLSPDLPLEAQAFVLWVASNRHWKSDRSGTL